MVSAYFAFSASFRDKYMIAKKNESAKGCENGHMVSANFAYSASFRDKIKDCEKRRKSERLRKVIYVFRVFRVFRVLSR